MKFAPPPPSTPTVNVLLYGPPKTGKSTGALTAPGKVLYMNADLPGAARFARQYHGDRIQELELEGFRSLVEVAQEAYSPSTEYGSIVVDPIGELHRQLLEQASDRAISPSLPTYLDVGVQLERFCRALCKAPLNVIFVCHDHPIKDESSGEILQLPYTGTSNPKAGRVLMGMVDIIGYTGVIDSEVPEYVAQLIHAKGRSGGDRFGALGKSRAVDIANWLDTIKAAEAQREEK